MILHTTGAHARDQNRRFLKAEPGLDQDPALLRQDGTAQASQRRWFDRLPLLLSKPASQAQSHPGTMSSPRFIGSSALLVLNSIVGMKSSQAGKNCLFYRFERKNSPSQKSYFGSLPSYCNC